MTPALALRFAQTLLKDNGHLSRFDVEVEDDIVEPLREALVQLGCKVRVDLTKGRLYVTCPKTG